MIYLVFMNYIMLVAICGNMKIITSDSVWIALDIIGVFAMIIHCCLMAYKKESEEEWKWIG